MATISLNPSLNLQAGKSHPHRALVVEEIEGLIRLYKDGRVERFAIVPSVNCTGFSEVDAYTKDAVIDKFTNLWVRFYVPNYPGKLPLLIYFHGGGFCVGSAAWSCYHEFLTNLASQSRCVVISVSYRLAPENRLPAAYDDGVNTVMWVKERSLDGLSTEHKWWLSRCDLSKLFLAGDSAGANIAYNVAVRLGKSGTSASNTLKPLQLNGLILIQPFFGGETRTGSEKTFSQAAGSALTLSASDAYWRLSLPLGANRDHPWCSPLLKGVDLQGVPSVMVCISELDILKDRNLQFCKAIANVGKRVETTIYQGVGHAFQVLHKSPICRSRTQEMISNIKDFITQ